MSELTVRRTVNFKSQNPLCFTFKCPGSLKTLCASALCSGSDIKFSWAMGVKRETNFQAVTLKTRAHARTHAASVTLSISGTWSRGGCPGSARSSSALHRTRRCSWRGSRTLRRSDAAEAWRARHTQSGS
uniref:Uncharacterized protein n=1 Tax=Anguilla anguilla TaxID=7936 RepID=A0A0E9W7M7_ANGAN